MNMFRNYYFINKFETKNIDKLDKKTIIIYRDYSSKLLNEELILKIKKYCKKKSIKFCLSNNIKLAIKLGLDGVYLPSFNSDFNHLSFSLKKNFTILGSAHNLKEIKIKQRQKVEKIFISSLFKRNKNYLGINKFKLLAKQTHRKVVVLGGISKENLKKLKLLNLSEFMGYILNKKRPL